MCLFAKRPGIEATSKTYYQRTNMCTGVSLPQRFMLMRERRVTVTLATNGSRGWASGQPFSLASLVPLWLSRNEWISLVIFPGMAFKTEVYWLSIKEAARCYWITTRKPLVITSLMRPSCRVWVSQKLFHLTSESIYSNSVLFLDQVYCITSHCEL